MLTEQRKQHLLETLRRDGRVIAKDVSAALGLSEDTIRRDLRELAASGKLMRVHGGALPLSPTIAGLATRSTMKLAEKQRLGRAAAELVRPGQMIFIDGGTTHLELVKALPRDLPARVVTHSPTIASAFESHDRIEVILVGGTLFRQSMVAVGATVLETIGHMHFDLCFIGANGLHPEAGLMTGDYEEAKVKRHAVARSGEVVTLLTSDKCGVMAPHAFCGLDQLSLALLARESRCKIPGRLTSKFRRV